MLSQVKWNKYTQTHVSRNRDIAKQQQPPTQKKKCMKIASLFYLIENTLAHTLKTLSKKRIFKRNGIWKDLYLKTFLFYISHK